MSSVKINLRALRGLQAKLEELDKRHVKVGLLASTAPRVPVRPGEIDDNPSLGLRHEFGFGTPRRSFIKMPLTQHLGDTLNRDDTNWGEFLLKQGAGKTLRRLGKLGERTIQDAFDSGGFGQWPRLSPVTVFRKTRNKTRILIETTQLRRAITSEVA